jgi:hypothetical protein
MITCTLLLLFKHCMSLVWISLVNIEICLYDPFNLQIYEYIRLIDSVTNSIWLVQESKLFVNRPCSVTNTKCQPNLIE